jgi:hypothetical protein
MRQAEFAKIGVGSEASIVGVCAGRKEETSAYGNYVVILEDCYLGPAVEQPLGQSGTQAEVNSFLPLPRAVVPCWGARS